MMVKADKPLPRGALRVRGPLLSEERGLANLNPKPRQPGTSRRDRVGSSSCIEECCKPSSRVVLADMIKRDIVLNDPVKRLRPRTSIVVETMRADVNIVRGTKKCSRAVAAKANENSQRVMSTLWRDYEAKQLKRFLTLSKRIKNVRMS